MSDLSKKELERLRKIAKGSGKKIEQSSIFLSIFTENYENDPVPALQLGLAMIMDKPIVLVVPEGVIVPENIKKVAQAIEYFDRDDKASMGKATRRLVAIMKDKLEYDG